MTKILRNALLAAAAVSGLAGSAMAAQQAARTECGNAATSKTWGGRCCGDTNCLGGESHNDHDRSSRAE
jgi:hypothetical protein